ncbi:MAG: hypothetical protein Q9177_006302 [Variospora cf. flavescens]
MPGALTAGCRAMDQNDVSGVSSSGRSWHSGVHVRIIGPRTEAPVTCLGWSPDGRRVAVRRAYGHGSVLDTSGSELARLPPPTSYRASTAIHFTPDGQHVLLSGRVLGQPQASEVCMTLAAADTGRVVREIPGINVREKPLPPVGLCPERVVFHPPTSTYYALLFVDFTSLITYASGDLLPRVLTSPGLFAAGFDIHKTGNAIAGVLSDGKFRVYFLEPEPRYVPVQAHSSPGIEVRYDPTGSVLASWGTLAEGPLDKPEQIKIWRHPDYELQHALDYPRGQVRSLAFHPDGTVLAAASNSHVALFETATYRTIGIVAQPITHPRSMEFSPDGTMLAIGGGAANFAILAPSANAQVALVGRIVARGTRFADGNLGTLEDFVTDAQVSLDAAQTDFTDGLKDIGIQIRRDLDPTVPGGILDTNKTYKTVIAQEKDASGVFQPITKDADFEDFTGKEIPVQTFSALNGDATIKANYPNKDQG